MYGKDRSKQASNSIYSKQCHTRRQSSLFIPDLSFPISTLPRPVPSFLVVFWTCPLLSRTFSFLFIPFPDLPSPIPSCPSLVLASLIITALSPVLFYQDLSRSTSSIYRSPIRSPSSAVTCLSSLFPSSNYSIHHAMSMYVLSLHYPSCLTVTFPVPGGGMISPMSLQAEESGPGLWLNWPGPGTGLIFHCVG